MEYFKLILGIVLLVAFTWILVKNSNRTSFIHALLRIDTLLGLVASVYLVFTSAYSLLVQ
jgi:hypothetical protein